MSSSSTNKANHLLLIFIKEPIEGQVKQQLASSIGEQEATVRYKVLCQTLLSQLVGLTDTDVKFCITPKDAIDSVKFWLLPLLEGEVSQVNTHIYNYSPNSNSAPLQLEFSSVDSSISKQNILEQQTFAFQKGYTTVSTMGTSSPDCGARWINAGRLLCKNEDDIIVGLCQNNTPYLSIVRKPHYIETCNVTKLPKIHKIKSEQDWNELLNTPIAGKINSHYKSITGKGIF